MKKGLLGRNMEVDEQAATNGMWDMILFIELIPLYYMPDGIWNEGIDCLLDL